eukprot:3791147-Pleurochrysis_carterae.AAC.3
MLSLYCPAHGTSTLPTKQPRVASKRTAALPLASAADDARHAACASTALSSTRHPPTPIRTGLPHASRASMSKNVTAPATARITPVVPRSELFLAHTFAATMSTENDDGTASPFTHART